MKFDTDVLMANPAIRSSLEAEARLAEDRARLAKLNADANRAAFQASLPKSFTASDIKANPWQAAAWNLTHQAMILKADPARAEQLREEAGLAGYPDIVSKDDARIANRMAVAKDKGA